jgi:hypothetical protein
MSTPMPPKPKLEVLNFSAPRRVHDHVSDAITGSPPRQYAQGQQQTIETEEQAAVEPEAVEVTRERLDDSIRQAIEMACLADDTEVREAAADVAEADEAEADEEEPRLPPASRLQTPRGGNPDRLWAEADAHRPDRDMAQMQTRRRRRLEPEVVPEPPRGAEFHAAPLLLRFVLVVGFAAIAAYGVTAIGSMRMRFPAPLRTVDDAAETAPVAAEAAAPPAPILPVPAPAQVSARLIVQNKQSFTNEPIELGISVDGATGQESLLFAGLTKGTRFSAGAPMGDTRWELALNDLRNVHVYAPKDFVGVMNAAVDLLSPNAQLLDYKPIQFAWVARPAVPSVDRPPAQKTAPVQPRDPAQEAIMLKRGEDLLGVGDIAGARRVFQYLADAGNADGALAMGATFDARFLAEHSAIGVAADDVRARSWYRRAADLGSLQAKTLLAEMADQ